MKYLIKKIAIVIIGIIITLVISYNVYEKVYKPSDLYAINRIYFDNHNGEFSHEEKEAIKKAAISDKNYRKSLVDPAPLAAPNLWLHVVKLSGGEDVSCNDKNECIYYVCSYKSGDPKDGDTIRYCSFPKDESGNLYIAHWGKTDQRKYK